MIPSINPPTDNLYKFISLFGLTIFLFSTYNLGIVYDQATANKMEIEGLKVEFEKEKYKKSPSTYFSLKADESRLESRVGILKRLDKDLHKIEYRIFASNLDPIDIFQLTIQTRKLKVSLNMLRLKQNFCIGLVITGISIMVWGFVRWKKREQDIRDKILEIEHIIKQKERDFKGKAKKKKNKNTLPEIVQITEEELVANN